MNVYGQIILTGVIVAFLVGRGAEVLNLTRLGDPLPRGFADVYDPATYRRAQEYTRVHILFGILVAAVELAILLAFWLLGGFGWLDDAVRSLGLGVIGSGLVYLGSLLAARAVVSLPFSVYSTFVIEERFGFNRTSRTTFAADRLKGLFLGLALGGPLLVGVLALFEYAGPWAWLWAWLAATFFVLAVQVILPTWIMPLFNRFTPLEEGELRDAILGLARRVDFPLKGVYVMDGSRRSSKSNAFFTGFGRNKRIALFDTLIARHTVEELVAVLAHEIGHYKRRHVLKGTFLGVLHLGASFALLAVVLRQEAIFSAFYVEQASTYVGLVIFGVLLAPVELVLSALGLALSRSHEYEADRFAAEVTGQPRVMVGALKKLSRDNLSNLTPHPAYVVLNYSHPPVAERARVLEQ